MGLGEQLARAQAGANILGRLAVLRDSVRKTKAPLRFNSGSRLVSFSDSSDGLDASLYTSFTLPPTNVLEYLRNLTPVTRTVFDGLSKQYQLDSFTIAGVTDQRILQRIQADLGTVIEHGGTAEDFRKAVHYLQTQEGIEKLSAFEIDNVFQNMTQKAYAAGRYEQQSDESVVEALPYWQYWTVGDDRVRPAHRALNRFCALAIDPVWRKIYPPCGWGCRCACASLSADEAPEGSDEGGLNRRPSRHRGIKGFWRSKPLLRVFRHTRQACRLPQPHRRTCDLLSHL
jgi:SPP1 gp7 family putative phage head morphogenesis protein